jgi:hypothetical protein
MHAWIGRNGRLLVVGGVLLGLLLGGTLGMVTNRSGTQLAAARPEPAYAAGPGTSSPPPTMPPATHRPGSLTGTGQPAAVHVDAAEHKRQKGEHAKRKHRHPDKGDGHKASGD